MANATETRERPYIVIVDALSLAWGDPTKHGGVRLLRGKIVRLIPGDEQTKRLLEARSIAPYREGQDYSKRVNIATVAAGYGAVDAVAERASALAANGNPDAPESERVVPQSLAEAEAAGVETDDQE